MDRFKTIAMGVERGAAPLVVIVGGAVVDVVGKSAASEAETLHTSQNGTTWTKDGGVARNIAEGCGRLGLRTKFVGSVGADDVGGLVKRNLSGAGVDATSVTVVPNTATATYQCILSKDGGLVAAVADMRTHEAVNSEFLSRPSTLPPREDTFLLCFDANITADAMRTLLAKGASPRTIVVHEPTSVPKSARCGGLLAAIDIATPNDYELFAMAEAIGGGSQKFTDITAAAKVVLGAGVLFVVVTLGPKGVAVYTQEPPAGAAPEKAAKWRALWGPDAAAARAHGGEVVRHACGVVQVTIPALDATIVDVTGAGDSLTAGMIAGVAKGMPLAESIARVGLRAAKSTLESKFSVSEHLGRDVAAKVFMAIH